MTFSTALIHDFRQLKPLFSGEKELLEIGRSDGTLYFNRWQVVWIIATLPFATIAFIFLKAMAMLLRSNRFHLLAQHAFRNVDYLFTRWKLGNSLWIPTDNGYQSHLSTIVDLPSIKRKDILDPFIRGKLHPDLKKVKFNLIDKGLCWGACFWFNFLLLKRGIKHLIPVAKQFEQGQPSQAALLQSLVGLELDLLDLSIQTIDWIARDEVGTKTKLLRDGIYVIKSQEHAVSYIKWEGKEFIWDPRDGLIAIDSEKLFLSIIDDTLGEKRNFPLDFYLLSLR